MRTESDMREYLENRFFINRYHAFAVRAIINDKFKSNDFNFKWKMKSESGEKLITANDALDFLTSRK